MNEVIKRFLLVILANSFLITGCATHTDCSLILDFGQIKGYGFSIPQPQEPGWNIITKTNKSIYLARTGDNLDETYAILIDVIDNLSLDAIEGKSVEEK